MHVWPWSCQKPSMIKNILLHMMPVIRFSAGISNRSLIGRKRHVVDINLKCLISFRPSSESNLPCELELSIFKPKLRSRVHLRSNLIDTGIAICSPSVPTTFSDASNLDLATINGFVKRMLDDAAISGEEVFLYRHLYILYRLYYIIFRSIFTWSKTMNSQSMFQVLTNICLQIMLFFRENAIHTHHRTLWRDLLLMSLRNAKIIGVKIQDVLPKPFSGAFQNFFPCFMHVSPVSRSSGAV